MHRLIEGMPGKHLSFSRMVSADVVQTKGFAFPLCSLMKRRISPSSWVKDVKTPRFRRLRVRVEKKPSTAFSQDAEVGV